jgi:hypothetical protein
MGNPYTSVSVDAYNANPPTDNGAATANNKIDWAKIKSKVGDPCVAAIGALNTNVGAAFAKTFGNAATILSAVDVDADANSQGVTFVFTAAGKTLTLPDAAVIGSPFTMGVRNGSTGIATIAAATATPTQHVNGAATVIIGPGQGGILFCNGVDFFYIGPVQGESYEAGVKTLFFQTAAPLGWVKDTSLDDAGIKLVSGTVGADAGTVAFSSVFNQLTIAKANLPSYNLTVTESPHAHTYAGHTSFGNAGSDNGIFGNTWFAATTTRGTSSVSTGLSVASGGSGTPIDLRMKYAAAIRATKG